MASIPLSKAIGDLRAELLLALGEGRGKALRFKLKPVELELKVTMSWEGEAHGGVKFWVVDVGAKGSEKSENAHTLKLTLEPVSADGATEFIVTDRNLPEPP